jgi:hypothetical protein
VKADDIRFVRRWCSRGTRGDREDPLNVMRKQQDQQHHPMQYVIL